MISQRISSEQPSDLTLFYKFLPNLFYVAEYETDDGKLDSVGSVAESFFLEFENQSRPRQVRGRQKILRGIFRALHHGLKREPTS